MWFEFPAAAQLNKPLSKKDIIAFAKPTTKERELLTLQVERIRWCYKLSEATLNIPPAGELAEVQVFCIQLKDGINTIDERLLRLLDCAIPSPILFEIQSAAGLQLAASYKSGNQATQTQPYLYSRSIPISLHVSHCRLAVICKNCTSNCLLHCCLLLCVPMKAWLMRCSGSRKFDV